jgi:hypothetical protein
VKIRLARRFCFLLGAELFDGVCLMPGGSIGGEVGKETAEVLIDGRQIPFTVQQGNLAAQSEQPPDTVTDFSIRPR